MTDPKQPIYDILGEAFKAGRTYVTEGYDLSAASVLFPLAARMEEEVKKLIEQEAGAWILACSQARKALRELGICHKPTTNRWKLGSTLFTDEVKAANCLATELALLRARSLPSSPKRET